MSEETKIPLDNDDVMVALSKEAYVILNEHYDGDCAKCSADKGLFSLDQLHHIKQNRCFFAPKPPIENCDDKLIVNTYSDQGHTFYVADTLRCSKCNSIIARVKDGHFMVLGQIIVSKTGERYEYVKKR